jgi:DNA uptake protein ComE-like DNA-binding protein
VTQPEIADTASARSTPAHLPPKFAELWTFRQRRVVAGLIVVILIVVAARWWNRPQFVPDPPETSGLRSAELLNRIDPNVADWRRLSVLPGIGERRARTIIAYRSAFEAAHPGRLAFEHAEDLANVKGIGPATVENLKPLLIFPLESPHDGP